MDILFYGGGGKSHIQMFHLVLGQKSKYKIIQEEFPEENALRDKQLGAFFFSLPNLTTSLQSK